MSVIETLTSLRKDISPDFVYDQGRADMLHKQRERDLQERVRRDSMNYYASKDKLIYSGMPNKYRDMKFTDLLTTRDNSQAIIDMTRYVKNFKKMSKGVGLIGEMGVGKTTLIAITVKEIVKRYDKTVYFASEHSILSEIKRTINDNSLDNPEDVIRRIAANDLVVIDEFGSTTNNWEISMIKNIMDAVINNNHKLFITSNYSTRELLERWKDGDTNKTPRQIIDRMSEVMTIATLQGKSFRRN